jgi:hypothetical protein
MVRARSKLHHALMNLNGEIPIELYGYFERSVALSTLRNITGQDYGYNVDAWRKWINENKPGALPTQDKTEDLLTNNLIKHPLEIAYQNYLENAFDSIATENLVAALEHYDLNLESQALKTYLNQGAGAKYTVDIWNGRLCNISFEPPLNAQPGDLWFDLVELNLAILIPNPVGMSHHVTSWISTHPVKVWQYRTFLNLVEIGEKIDVFPAPLDYLNSIRFQGKDGLFCITDLYQDEALAYSGWMRKNLCGQMEAIAARAYLSSDEFSTIFPPILKLWESDDFQEWYRTAIGRSNIDKKPSYEYEHIIKENYQELESQPDRMLYEEWDCRSNIGMLTIVPVSTGLSQQSTFSTFHYEILNRVPHPTPSGVL